MVRKETVRHLDGKQAYDQLIKSCLSLDAQQNKKKLFSFKSDFAKSSKNLQTQVAIFKERIADAPLSSLVLLWGESISEDKVFGGRYLEMMRELIETGLLTLATEKTRTVNLKDFSLQDPSLVIDNIRCRENWTVSKREDNVLLYKTFSEWLSKETFGYVPEAKDIDRTLTQNRLISFENYIEILSHMDLREQILTKMFYLGGSRALEEVLSVKIEDIDFSRSLVHFSDDVSYPRHLFDDIKKYIQNRKKGYVFAGKDGERVSTTTPFRALKKIASELRLDPEFTFKDFTKNT